MIKVFNTIILIVFALTLGLGNFLLMNQAQAAGLELVKSVDFGTVYYIDSQGVRHPFPNQLTYESWYGKDFSRIVTVSNDILSNYPLGKNITIRPGTSLVKVRTAPQVYAVEQGGVLRELQSEGIAEGIYGEDWAKRVVDVPDVFFGDYVIGQMIVHDYTIPDSILYFDKDSKDYFYRNNGILRKFLSAETIKANFLNPSYALPANRSYFVRERPITGFDKNIFNPTAKPLTDKRDCANTNLRAGIIVVGDSAILTSEIDKLQLIKKEIPQKFSWATNGLSSIDVSYPTAIMLDDGYLITKRNDGTAEIRNELINTFYDNHPDEFDFLVVWSNFNTPAEVKTNEIAHFIPVTNKLEGVGKGNLNRSEIYGSTGKLKGIIMMGNINKYDTSTLSGMNAVLNTVNHEILHHWSAYVDFIDETGELNSSLLRPDDKQHWSIYAGFVSPLGGSGWVDNGNGTYTSKLSTLPEPNLRQYSSVDLYLMGLIPKQLMGPITYLEPKNQNEIGNTISATLKTIDINQIIKAEGDVKCSIF